MPLVSVLLAVHDDDRYLPAALDSVLRQTVDDLELIVVDDASSDETPRILSELDDRRLVLLRNDEQLGLAASLNRGLDVAQGRYIARLDADDVALPNRLELQLSRIGDAAVLGSAVRDIDENGQTGTLHRNPLGTLGVRWLSLFSSPFFHPTVLVSRDALGDLRYDPSYRESEDYDLWTRLLMRAEGRNLAEPLVLKRVHAGQASSRRADLQLSFQRQIAVREIARVAPHVDAERAWRVGARKRGGSRKEFLRLLAAFDHDREVLAMAARALLSPRRRS